MSNEYIKVREAMLRKILRCPSCQTVLDEGYTCSSCRREYLQGKHVGFIPYTVASTEAKRDGVLIWLKEFFKRFPALYYFLANAFGALILRRRGKELAHLLGEGAVGINLGSGPMPFRYNAFNIDFFPYENVDVVADISRLPLYDASVDLVICEYVLEHVAEPEAVLTEIARVLKPGGTACIAVPFTATFHSAPDDYHRWTRPGLVFDMEKKGLTVTEVGISCGPTAAMLNVLTEWLAMLLSFGIPKLYGMWLILFMIIACPLRYLDLLLYRFPNASNLAHCFYAVGKKRT